MKTCFQYILFGLCLLLSGCASVANASEEPAARKAASQQHAAHACDVVQNDVTTTYTINTENGQSISSLVISQDLKGNYSAQMIESNLNALKEMFNNTDGVADFEKTEDGVRYFVTFSDIMDYMTLYPDLKKNDVEELFQLMKGMDAFESCDGQQLSHE